MRLALILPAMGLCALAATGCGGNQLNQPMTGQTPETITPTSPKYGEAGGPLVPANYPGAGTTQPPGAGTAGAGTTQPPAAAPAAREFTVYFPFNKSTLSSEAKSTLAEAVSTAKQGPTHISVTGHTDTVGSEDYNQRLSDARAEAVRQALIGKGVPQDTIAVKGVGKSDLAVQTADGVKEPRNRRVVIMEGGPGA